MGTRMELSWPWCSEEKKEIYRENGLYLEFGHTDLGLGDQEEDGAWLGHMQLDLTQQNSYFLIRSAY